MIETLHGMKETVNFKTNTKLRLYMNDECENYPSHWHIPLEIIMPTESDYRVACSKTVFCLSEGDILIINPGVVHSMEAPPIGERLIFQADVTLLYGMRELETTLSFIAPALHITAEESPFAHERIRQLLLSIKEEYFAEASLSEASIYSKLIEIFVLIGRNNSPNAHCFYHKNSKQREYTERFLFICNYINEHCGEDLTLDEISDLSGFSKYHFSRLFKQFTNVSFYRYLNNKRIAYAENLLMNDELTITEIALQCGFSSLSSFIRMFKIVKNCTPTEFKMMYTT
ncbi:MAG TPA: AraC family transcriptional regulator [Lachnoclostridium phytofermentans]|uniref:AraC family transcriptional regulator n=1 Tax=Lachnoclostridium phytofermentans TaxID=66219 RepID=A0A3D2X7T9_9FIRM|nr:AraC family transcriptional regulator [Lachnoclostridium sp.]HCL02408.1 AraC family transcriptional regulator [Lachnoclostridium phytofermentans]